MNRNLFIQLLQQPYTSTKEQENDLRDILRTYPYFQAAQVLLAKNLHNQNSYLYEKQLKTAALYAGSRKLLYHFIQKTQEETAPRPIIQVMEPVVETETTEVISPVTVAEPEPMLVEDKVPPAARPVKETWPEAPTDLETAADIIEEIHPPEELLQPAEEVLTEAPGVVEEPVVAITANEPHSFDEWLKLMNTPHAFIREEQPVIVQPALVVNEQETLTEPGKPEILQVSNESSTQTSLVNKNKAFDTDSIIEKFIKESPSISRPKAEFFNPINMAKISIEEDDDLATETLAKIYTKQGNYKKAIRIYEKLCLKFPDKLPYFVALIQKIKSDNKID